MWYIFLFPGEKLYPRRSHFRGEAIFKKNLLPLPCKECSKSFSESGSLKTHLTLIQEKSHLLVKNVPNNFLRRSHSPVHCSLFHKRKSVVSFKDSKNFNLFSSSSFLSLSSFLFKYVFKYVLIVEEIIDHDLTENIWMKKRKLLSCQSHFQIVLSRQLLWQS